MKLQNSIFILSLLIGFGNAITKEDCPSNIPRGNHLQTYKGMCYEFKVNQHRHFWPASKDCKNRGGSLVIINSSDVNDFLYEHLSKYGVRYEETWIGLFYSSVRKTYVWLDGRVSIPGDYWNVAPYAFTYKDNYCVSMAARGEWHAHRCESHWLDYRKRDKRYYICQYKPKTTLHSTTLTSTTQKDTTQKTVKPKINIPTVTEQPTTPQLTTQTPTTINSITQTTTHQKTPNKKNKHKAT